MAAKWAAVTRVLADPSSGGATVLDVRLPDRPAASFEDPESAAAEPPAAGTAGAVRSTGATGTTGAQPGPATGTSTPGLVQPQP